MIRTAVLCATLLVSLPAFAQEAPEAVPIHFAGDVAHLEFEVSIRHEKQRLTCNAPCTLWVWPGSYRVRMRGRGVAGTSKDIDVFGPTSIDAEAGSRSGRTTGLVLGLAGVGVAAFGLALYMVEDMCLIGGGCSPGDHTPNPTPFVVLMGAGALVSVVGWVIYGSSASSLKVSSTPRVWVTPTPSGASLSFTAMF
jgi:hypothetical protein